ncbi:hypothetical protein RCL1_004028 [Eukaryota sp. TZLM3-RCL]
MASKPPIGPPSRRKSREESSPQRWRAHAVLDERDVIARRNAAALMASDPSLRKLKFGTAEYYAVFDRLVSTWQNIVQLAPHAEPSLSEPGRIAERRRSISLTPEAHIPTDRELFSQRRRHTITSLPSEFSMPGYDEDQAEDEQSKFTEL